MIDQYGMWKWNPNTPEEKWCDYDYVAEYIVISHYQPSTSIENIVHNIICYYDGYRIENNVDYYCIEKDPRPYPQCLMINMADVSWFVRDNGGIKEFDFLP